MSNTNKYPCPDCGGDGGNNIHNPSGTYYSSCASCGGSGKEKTVITREEYEDLKSQLSTANERINSQSGTIQRLKERENKTDKVLIKDSQLLQTANDQIRRMRELIGRLVITPNISANEMEKLYDEAVEFLKQPAPANTGKEDNNE